MIRRYRSITAQVELVLVGERLYARPWDYEKAEFGPFEDWTSKYSLYPENAGNVASIIARHFPEDNGRLHGCVLACLDQSDSDFYRFSRHQDIAKLEAELDALLKKEAADQSAIEEEIRTLQARNPR